eukprot:TRINITY_DN195_c0_g1_i1.p1 TRINITY_DN195_c0_g1~~TRINITY_DN195_c0_g1_i1.p1  ORF type:complete len:273 (+),score=61.15 TRINITY_DN195_c0_g1_i1:141-959(+)
MQSTISHDPQEEHWYDKNDPMNLTLPHDKNAKVKHVNRPVIHIIVNILLRMYGLIIAALMIAMGAYLEYQIKDNLSPYLKVVEFALMGAFFIVCGVLTLLIETRTHATLKHCLSAYFFLGNPLARGLFYLLVGGLTFVQKFDPPYVKGWWVGCAILGCGGLNLIYYPFYWAWRRERSVNEGQVEQVAYPEEQIYGFDIYFKKDGANGAKKDTELKSIKVDGEKKPETEAEASARKLSSASDSKSKAADVQSSSSGKKSELHHSSAGAEIAVQ